MAMKLTDITARRLLRDLVPNAAERELVRPAVIEHIRSGRKGPCRFCREQAELWNNPQIAADCNVSDPPSLA